jgi:pyrroline-5-carboxylate reductase
MSRSFGFIGGGRVTRILLAGFSRAGYLPDNIAVADPEEEVFRKLSAAFPSVRLVHVDNKAAARQDFVFGALHPQAMPAVLENIASELHAESVFVSLAPRVTITKLSEMLQGFTRIVRLLPNAPSFINKGYNPVAFSSALGQGERSRLLDLFRLLGECPEVAEDKLEAYAILVAMGPTYFWFQWQQLLNLGLSFGLERVETEKALLAMIGGAAESLFNSGTEPEAVMDLIPVKPLKEDEAVIQEIYARRLETLFRKLKS